MKKREKSNNVLKLLIIIFAITILVARVGSVRGIGGGGSSSSPAETSQPVTIASASPTDVSVSFTPQIQSTIALNKESYLGRTSTYTGPAIGTPDDTIKWKVTITGPSHKWLTPDMIDLDEVGWKDLVNSNIQTFHYPFKQSDNKSDNNLVALGSCDLNDLHDNSCTHDIGFSLDENDVFSNADKIKFNSDAPTGLYTIKYELVDTIGTANTADDQVLSNAYEVPVNLDTVGPTISDVSNNPAYPKCEAKIVDVFANINDPSEINRAWLNYNVTNSFSIDFKRLLMTFDSLSNKYKGNISLPITENNLIVSYEIAANDTLGNLAKTGFIYGYVYDCQVPTASFTINPTTPVEGSPVTFDASASSDTASGIKDYEWNFGDSSSPVKTTDKVVQHNYTDNGNYTITLKVTDNAGNVRTAIRYAIILNANPQLSNCNVTPEDEGSLVNLSCSFIDAGTKDNPHTATVDWGDGSAPEPLTVEETGGSGTVSGSHVYADNKDGGYPVIVILRDKDGGIGTDETTATITDLKPKASFTEYPVNPKEGQPVQFTDTSTSYDKIKSWHWDFGDEDSSDEQNATHIYKDNRIYTVTLTVTDSDGSTDTTSEEKVVSNVDPTAHANGPYSGEEGSPVTFTCTFEDPGVNDNPTCEWGFGDGSDKEIGEIVQHTYKDNGVYEVTLTVTDKDGGFGKDRTTATISNKPSVVDLENIPPTNEGDKVEITASFFNPGVNDEHSATVDWGDGTPIEDCPVTEIDGSGTADCSHVYKNNRDYTVNVSVSDGLDTGFDTTTATILDGTPTASFTEEPTSPEEGQLVQFTDTSTSPADDIKKWLWNFGDGSTSKDRNPTHTYLDDGTYNVTLTVTDEDDSTDTKWEMKVVSNAVPVVTPAQDQTTDEGANVSLVVATFTDDGILDKHRARIDWGDGTEETIGLVDESDGFGTVSGWHIYKDDKEGGYAVKVRVFELNEGIGTFNIKVNNIAPEVIAIADQITDKETGIGSVLANFTDAGILDDHTAVINWGDGTHVEDGIVNEEDGSGTVSGHHKYNKSGLFTITITVMDEFDSASDSLNAKVGDFVIDLHPGWNLFSVPKVLENSGLATLTSDLDDSISIILTYKDGQWIQPATVEPLKAYWINMDQPGKLLLRFKNASCTDSVCPVPGARQLNAGWELIGFTDTKPLMSRLALKSIEGSYSQWFGLVNNVWISHIFGQWPDKNLEPGRGYWVFMTQPKTLAVLSF